MSFEGWLGDGRLVAQFRSCLKKGTLGHAYVFEGRAGIGKMWFARELARAVLCVKGKDRACGTCRACALLGAGTHPDLLMAERAKGRQRLSIDDLRELAAWMSLKPAVGDWRVGIVDEAETMSPEAANFFLKTLEEPPPGSLLILVTTSALRLLPTIRSRCQIIRFGPVARERIEEYLRDQGVPGVEASALSCLACGSVGRAETLREKDVLGEREFVTKLLGTVGRGDPIGMSQDMYSRWTDKISGKLQLKRESVLEGLDLMIFCLRDLVWLREGGAADGAVNADIAGELAALASPASGKWLELVTRTREDLSANVRMELALDKLMLDMHAVALASPVSYP